MRCVKVASSGKRGRGRADKRRWAKVASILEDKEGDNTASHRRLNKALKMGLFIHWQL